MLVGPDNGLLAPAVAIVGGAERAVELTNPEYHLAAPGATFAGRDVFAPVAAHLCNGVDLAELGPLVDADLLMPGMVALPREEADGLHAEVLWVDRFGNCQLNVGPDDLDAGRRRVGGRRSATSAAPRTLATSFGELGPGSVGLVLDSQGMYALALDQRSAAAELRLAAGDARARRADRRRRSPPPTGRADPGRRCAATGSVRPVRPATTLAIGLLLAAILVAGVIALMRI